jgi:hypothetical protein
VAELPVAACATLEPPAVCLDEPDHGANLHASGFRWSGLTAATYPAVICVGGGQRRLWKEPGYTGVTVTMTPRWSLAVAVVASKSLARRSGESQR